MASSPPQIEGQDEALKTLILRYQATPSAHFEELASKLLSRGNAQEALRILDEAMEENPNSIEGRVVRAEALIALRKPRIAFLDLKRALSLKPDHARAMRLLGKVYLQTGHPDRAAELLAQRSSFQDPADAPRPRESRTSQEIASDLNAGTQITKVDNRPPRISKPEHTDLAADLALSPRTRPGIHKVEVTQIIRRRQPADAKTALTAIEGPIVDTGRNADETERSQDFERGDTAVSYHPIRIPSRVVLFAIGAICVAILLTAGILLLRLLTD